MKIAIIGTGFLGNKLVEYFSKEHEVLATDLNPKNNSTKKLDATSSEEVNEFILKNNSDVVINTVALTSSVACEKNPALCKTLNYETAKNIAQACKEIGAKMIFMSSSYVFGGETGSYKETDKTNPTNEYAKNKILAEEEILKIPNSIIIRTEPMYGFDKTINQLKFGTGTFEKEVIEMGYPEIIRSPIFIDDVPKIFDKLLEKEQTGIFHIAGPKKINFLEFLKKLASLINAQEKIKIVDSSNWVVKSPHDSSLNISKINSLGIKTTPLEDALQILKTQLNKNS